MAKGNCDFKGSGGEYFVTVVIHLFLINMLTLGFYSPWALVRLFKLKASHSVMNGKTVSFTGTGARFFVILLVNGLLTMVTFGIYGPWAICKVLKWKTENTLVGGAASDFKGTGGSLFLLYLIHLMILPMVTLGLYYLVGLFKFYAWKEEHSRYGGERTSFGAGLGEFVKISIINWVLNLVTLNLFSPWALCMLYRWQLQGLTVGDGPEVAHFKPVKVNPLIAIALVIVGLIPLLALGFIVTTQINHVLQLAQISAQRARPTLQKREGPLRLPIKRPPRKPAPPAQEKAPKESAPKEAPATRPSSLGEKPAKKAPGYQKELKKLDEVIKEHRDNVAAYYNRGRIQGLRGDLAKALKDYTKAISLDNKMSDAYYNRGLVHVKMKQYESALGDFSTVIKLEPGAADAYCNRGNVLYHLGRLDDAIRDYSKALQMRPNHGNLYYNRAVAYTAKGQKQKAMVDLKKAAELGQEEAKEVLKGVSRSR